MRMRCKSEFYADMNPFVRYKTNCALLADYIDGKRSDRQRSRRGSAAKENAASYRLWLCGPSFVSPVHSRHLQDHEVRRLGRGGLHPRRAISCRSEERRVGKECRSRW